MRASELSGLRDHLREQGIVFAYSGYITESVLGSVGDALKQKLTYEDADTRTIRSVFAVFVEQMQNIIRYSVEQLPARAVGEAGNGDRGSGEGDLRYGILTIGQEGSDYVVHAGNLVRASDVPQMRERLSALQRMSREDMKAAYKDQLRKGPPKGSKGAGIGFIEIARRASKPIEFDFMEVDTEHAFFALKASI